MAKWKCDHCGTVHRRNPSKCRSCGNTVLSPYHGDEGGLLADARIKYALAAAADVHLVAAAVDLGDGGRITPGSSFRLSHIRITAYTVYRIYLFRSAVRSRVDRSSEHLVLDAGYGRLRAR
jgi:hypothetical protein